MARGTYQSRVLGEFPEEGQESLCKRQWIRDAFERWDDPFMLAETIGTPWRVAVDPAHLGPDSTIMVLRQGRMVREILEWRRKETTESVGRVQLEMRERDIDPKEVEIVVDAPGIGAGVVDQLKERKANVLAFNGANTAVESDRYANMRAEAFWNLRQMLHKGEIALPPDQKLEDELVDMRWSVNSAGRIQIEGKDELRGRIGRSPDRADAVALAFYHGVRGPVRTWIG